MKCFLFLVFCCIPFSFFAKNVDVITAEKIAKFVLTGTDAQTRTNEIDVSLIWTGEDMCTRTNDSPAYYVFNKVGGNGFVIVSGDDIIKPILAYSYVNSFHVENMPDNLRAWMAYYREQINWAREENIVSDEETIWAWERLRDEIDSAKNSEEVLIETALWDQTAPYNLLCPTINGTQAPTGCVATALAIVMKYNRWPDQGSGMTFQYTTKQYKQTLSATYNIVYDWDNMLNKYEKGNYSTEQAEAVSQLMYHCGVFSEMDYTPRSSGALTLTAMGGMVRYMKYDKSMTLQSREWYTEAEWNSLLKKELDAGRLIIYGGSNNKEEGHQFVLDGYKQNDYHVNWGWGGMANGYYLLSTLEPDQQGIGGNTGGGFSIGQNAIVGIKKAETGSSYRDMLAFFKGTSGGVTYSGLSTTETDFLPGTSFDVTAAFIANYGIRNFTGVAALALVDKAGNVKEFISNEYTFSKLEAMNSNGSISGSGIGLRCTITQTPEPGDRIWLMYKANDVSTWDKVKGGRDVTTEIIVRKEATGLNSMEQDNTPDIIVLNNNNQITIKSSVTMKTLTVYDMEGRLLEKIECPQLKEFTFSCEDYTPGIYILKVLTTEGVISNKFIK